MTPEALRITAEIMENCGKVTEGVLGKIMEEMGPSMEAYELYAEKRRKEREGIDRRAEFLATLNASDANYQKRVTAFDRLEARREKPRQPSDQASRNPCASLGKPKVTTAQLSELWKAAEEAGDLIARARGIACSLTVNHLEQMEEKDPQRMMGKLEADAKRRQMTEQTEAKIKALFVQHDPSVQDQLMRLFGAQYPNGYFQFAGVPLNGGDYEFAWKVRNAVRCGSSDQCQSERGTTMDQACAYQGFCDASTYDDYLRFYVFAPAKAQRFEQQRAAMSELFSGRDISKLTFVFAKPLGRNEDHDVSFFSSDHACY